MPTLTLQEIEPVTHDTYRLTFPRPDGYTFTPGQATEVTLAKDGLRDEARPFTFVSQPDQDELRFIIKSYPEHDGVTEHIPELEPGDRVRIGDAWGAIQDRGPGVFIAGGAGITPFIPILRQRRRQGTLQGCTLVFSNLTERDIILRDEWEAMEDEGLDLWLLVTDEPGSALSHRMLDQDALAGRFPDAAEQRFYLCGPQPMVEDLTAALKALGADPEAITLEE